MSKVMVANGSDYPFLLDTYGDGWGGEDIFW